MKPTPSCHNICQESKSKGLPGAHLGRSTAGARAGQRQRDMTWKQKRQTQTAKSSPRAFHGGRTGLPKAKGHDMDAKETDTDSSTAGARACQRQKDMTWKQKKQTQTAKGSPRAFHGGRTGLPKAKGHDMEAKETDTDSQGLTSGVPRRAHGLAKGKKT